MTSGILVLADGLAGMVLVVVFVAAAFFALHRVDVWSKSHPKIAENGALVLGLCVAVPVAALFGIGLGHLLWLGAAAVRHWFGA